MFNWIVSDIYKYLEPFNFVVMLDWIVWNKTVWSFNCVETNDWCLIELLVIHGNTWNHLTVCKQFIDV